MKALPTYSLDIVTIAPSYGEAGLDRLGGTTAGVVGSVMNSRTSAADRTTRYVYDAAGRQVYEVDATGAVTGTQYDAAGAVVATTQYGVKLSQGGELSAAQIEAAVKITPWSQDFSANTSGLSINDPSNVVAVAGALRFSSGYSSTNVFPVAWGTRAQPMGTQFSAEIRTDGNSAGQYLLYGGIQVAEARRRRDSSKA